MRQFSLQKKGNSDTHYNMDEPKRHDAKWNKPITKRQIMYDSTYVRYSEWSKSETESLCLDCNNGVARGWGNEELLCIGYGVLALKDEELQKWMVVLVEHCRCI